jgi:nucleoside-diphosphate kinase
MERTLLLVKPDGVARGLCGEVIGRFERTGLRLMAARLLVLSDERARELYAEHAGRPYLEELVAFMTSGPILATVWGGVGAIQRVRALLGATDPAQAAPGTVRGDLGAVKRFNVAHGSSCAVDAEREIALFFTPEDLIER